MKSDLISKLSGKKVEVKINNATISKDNCSKMPSEENEWRAKDDFQTLMRAEEIKSDNGRMKLVKELAKKQEDFLSKI